ncbi:hypothetical protein [Rhizobium ruizarguesonis]|uniref:hypothetical protein n=1 Tax=Rhizobium ruizarguesonis TaxID=2081791 RepID=UPI0013EEF21D|nr:hypothetical protein [Rhizobium ruizarguesonis]
MSTDARMRFIWNLPLLSTVPLLRGGGQMRVEEGRQYTEGRVVDDLNVISVSSGDGAKRRS